MGWRETYEQTDYRELPWYSPQPSAWVRTAVSSGWFRRGSRILDVGCGAGTNLIHLARSGFHVWGLDVAPGAVRAARRRALRRSVWVDVGSGSALQLPFREARFGGAIDIGCFHTLPVAMRPRYAEELHRVLGRRGRLLLSCVAREQTSERGPPHRLSLEEVVRIFEPLFLVIRAQHRPSRRGSLALNEVLLERRTRPQPPLR